MKLLVEMRRSGVAMRWCVFCLILFVGRVSSVSAQSFVPPEIHVPDGFKLEIAAAPPLVGYPLMACFDERGRLYVAESDGRNLTKKEEYLEQRPRFVRRLEDVDGDGVFDRQTIFADQMTMPEGGYWYRGALYIISAPYLWRLEDLNDDGIADRREKILGYMEFDGRANQHGPYLGPNGRLYFSGGHFGFDFLGADGSRTGASRSAGVFSCLPDGSDVRIEGQGPINPVDVVFTPEGEMLSTCAIYDSVGGRHDAIVHWIPGGLTQRVYGDALLPDTGFRLPAMTRWGQVAPGGFARYRGQHLGSDMTDSYVACHFNGHKVVNVSLARQGASFVSRERDLLWSDNVDFHPADVLEDADGSLLVLDTGAWLTWGCPYSETAKPEIRGAIYRLRKETGEHFDDPRGLQLDWVASPEVLIARLSDRRPAIRDRATETLVQLGASVVSPIESVLKRSDDDSLQRRLLWVLSRIKSDAAVALIRSRVESASVSVQHAAVRSLGILRDREAVPMLHRLLASNEPSVRRVAASALGLIGEAQSTKPLLLAAEVETDHYVNHALVSSLIQVSDVEMLRSVLALDSSTRVKTIALRVLHRRRDGQLEPADVLRNVSSEELTLRQEALAIVADRPDWGTALEAVFLQWQDSPSSSSSVLVERLVPSLVAREGALNEIGAVLVSDSVSQKKKDRLLSALGQLPSLPEELKAPVLQLFQIDRPETLFQLVSLVPRFSSANFAEPILKVASNRKHSALLRVRAAALLAADRKDLPLKLVYFLGNLLKGSEANPLLRREAARALGEIRFGAKKRTNIFPMLDLIPSLNAVEMGAVLVPFEQIGQLDPPLSDRLLGTIGERLLSQLRQATDVPGLDRDLWHRVFSIYDSSVQEAAHVLLESNVQPEVVRSQRLEMLVSQAEGGNASRGRAVFFGGKGACITCHRIEGQGGDVGPDLSRIGSIRQKRDLFEAILSPSTTIVNGYETCHITTQSGDVVTGVLCSETEATITLKDAAQVKTLIQRDQIERFETSPLSIMPEGLDQAMTPQELQDLVDFLWHCREP